MMSYIPHITTPEEVEIIQIDKKRREKLFEELQIKILKSWLSLVPEKVPKECKVVLSPGNDDKLAIDEVIKNDLNVIYGEENVVDLDGEHEVACCGWTNPTPWKTPRECGEKELLKKLEGIVEKVRNLRTAIFCFHCPPYDTEIDRAPQVDRDFRLVHDGGGRHVMVPVGSLSVRKIIEKHQPLLCLHGHVHESPGFVRIGRTICLNPGSEYQEGILRGYLVELEGESIQKLQRVDSFR